MGSKQNSFYFDNFIACADYSRKAAQLLDKGMRQFDPAQIGDMIEEMHEVEHAGDEKKHELLNVLAKAFITPIEREDIILLGQNKATRAFTSAQPKKCWKNSRVSRTPKSSTKR